MYMCMYTFSSSFLVAAFFFFTPFPPRSYHEEQGARAGGSTLGTPARKEVNAERKNVTENAQREVKYLGKQMIESVTGTTRSLLEINKNKMLCFID